MLGYREQCSRYLGRGAPCRSTTSSSAPAPSAGTSQHCSTDPRRPRHRRHPLRSRHRASPASTHLALDASDADALTRAAEGAAVLHNCANPGDYTQWESTWPPLAQHCSPRPSAPARSTPSPGTCTRTARSTGRCTRDCRTLPPTTRASSAPACGPTRSPHTTPAVSAPSRSAPRTTSAPASATNGHVTRVLPAALRGKGGVDDRSHRPAAHLHRRARRRPHPRRRGRGPGARTAARGWCRATRRGRSARRSPTSWRRRGSPRCRCAGCPRPGSASVGLVSPMMREMADLTVPVDGALRGRRPREPGRTSASNRPRGTRSAAARPPARSEPRTAHGRGTGRAVAPLPLPPRTAGQITSSLEYCAASSCWAAPPAAGSLPQPDRGAAVDGDEHVPVGGGGTQVLATRPGGQSGHRHGGRPAAADHELVRDRRGRSCNRSGWSGTPTGRGTTPPTAGSEKPSAFVAAYSNA